jgi:hypothetical protein
MKKNLIILVLLIIICVIATMIAENFLIGLSGLLLIPLMFILDLCFYITPLALIILAVLSIWQFIVKDYKKFDKFFMIFIMIAVFGILNLKYENVISLTNYFIKNEMIKLYTYILGLSMIGILTLYISQKKDTRYYIPIILFIQSCAIYYCFFRGI